MSRVYTRQLEKSVRGVGFNAFDACPASEIWVIRDVVIACQVVGQHFEFGVMDAAFDGFPLTFFTATSTLFVYRLDGASTVMEDGDQMYVDVSSFEVSVLVSGYKLTLP